VDCNSSSVDPLHDDGCEVYLDALDACTPTEACNGASVACPPLQVCNAGSCVAPQGLVALSVPLTAANTKHRFANVFPTPYPNLEGSAITVRVYAPGATGGFLEVGAVDGNSAFSPAVLQIELKTLKDKWTDITVPIVSLGGFNAKLVKQINLEVVLALGPTRRSSTSTASVPPKLRSTTRWTQPPAASRARRWWSLPGPRSAGSMPCREAETPRRPSQFG
jgi:hypothetical protein